jgi:hypothetical protein
MVLRKPGERTMQVFRELLIRGEPEALTAMADAIRQSLAEGWTQDVSAERHLRSYPVNGKGNAFCFACCRRGRRPAATLFLVNKDPGTLFVSNIVPNDQRELSYAEYNGILEEFANHFVEPNAAKTHVRFEMSEPNVDLDQWLSDGAAEKLRLFSNKANKSTGASHPSDRERWYDFILAANQEGADLTASTIGRWLHEVGGWDQESAMKLAIEYAFGRGLLTYADSQRVGA